MNRNEECTNYNKMVDMVYDLCALAGNTPEAIETRDRIMDCLTVKYSQPLMDRLELEEKYNIPDLKYLVKCIQAHDEYGEIEEQLGCPLLKVAIEATKNGIYAKDPLDENKLNYIPTVVLLYMENEWYLSNGCGNFRSNVKYYKELFWLKADRSE